MPCRLALTILFTFLTSPVWAQSALNPFSPSLAEEHEIVPVSQLDDIFVAAYMYRQGVPEEHLLRWIALEDTNPVRLPRLQRELIDRIRARAEELDKPVRIRFPFFPVHIQDDDYYPEHELFLIGAPVSVGLGGNNGCRIDTGPFTIRMPQLELVYPDGLQVHLTNGQLTQSTPTFMRIQDHAGLDNSGRRCVPAKVWRGTKLKLPVAPGTASELFYDLAAVKTYTEAWQASPDVAVGVACELTGVTLMDSYQEPFPKSIYCPVTDIYVRYPRRNEAIFSVNWNDRTGVFDTSGHMSVGGLRVPTFRPDHNVDKGLVNNEGLISRPHVVYINDCASGEIFTHRWTARDRGYFFRVWGEEIPEESIVLTELDGGFRVCTNDPAFFGTPVNVSWVSDYR